MHNALDKASIDIIQKIFPQIFKVAIRSKGGTPIAWAGYDATWTPIPLPTHPITGQQCVVLQGDQAMVLFLGGPQGQRGFTESDIFPLQDALNPGFSGGRSNRVAYFDFKPSRLRGRVTAPTDQFGPFLPPATATTAGAEQFPSYLDNHFVDRGQPLISGALGEVPYVYFSTWHKQGYNPLLHRNGLASTVGIQGLGGVQPYHESFDAKNRPVKYFHADSFQLVAAGPNGKFGPIGQWLNGDSAFADAVNNVDWKDNRTNFYDGKVLGARP